MSTVSKVRKNSSPGKDAAVVSSLKDLIKSAAEDCQDAAPRPVPAAVTRRSAPSSNNHKLWLINHSGKQYLAASIIGALAKDEYKGPVTDHFKGP